MAEEVKEEPAEKKRSPVMKSQTIRVLVYTLAILLVLSLAGVVAYYVTQEIMGGETETDIAIQRESTKILDPPLAMDMGMFTTILTDASGQTYTMRVQIHLTVSKQRPDYNDVWNELLDRKIQLTDAIYEVMVGWDPITLMGSHAKRQEGYSELRSAVNRAVNARMRNKIDGVYLTEFYIQ